jgi:hypothetical protein
MCGEPRVATNTASWIAEVEEHTDDCLPQHVCAFLVLAFQSDITRNSRFRAHS